MRGYIARVLGCVTLILAAMAGGGTGSPARAEVRISATASAVAHSPWKSANETVHPASSVRADKVTRADRSRGEVDTAETVDATLGAVTTTQPPPTTAPGDRTAPLSRLAPIVVGCLVFAIAATWLSWLLGRRRRPSR